MKPLHGKKILITAGPTWVAIDEVRVIANIATGETGLLLAHEAKKAGAHVTVLLGPIGTVSIGSGVRLKRFTYFDELARAVKRELLSRRYDIVIHAAAVSDYQPKAKKAGKISSQLSHLSLSLVRTPKIISQIKKIDKKIFLVMFKLEFCGLQELIRRARKALRVSGADLAVANTFSEKKYQAIILDKNSVLARRDSKKLMTKKLIGIIAHQLNSK